MQPVFICYAHADNEAAEPQRRWLDRLLLHLEPLRQQDDLAVFSDQDLDVGDQWHARIQGQLRSTRAVVLMLSPSFLASKYIRDHELPILLSNAEDRGLKILPLFVKPCLLEEVRFKYPDPKDGPDELTLADLQAFNSPEKSLIEMSEAEQERTLVSVARRVLEIVRETSDTEDEPPPPTPPETKTGARGVCAGGNIGGVIVTGDNANVVVHLPPSDTPTLPPPTTQPAAQPVKPPEAPPVDTHRLPSSGEFLVGRARQLGQLTKAWNNDKTNVITLVAFGGVGKSALVNHWLGQMAGKDYRGARRVYGWSAYSQGSKERVTSADVFIEQALRFFGEEGELGPSIEARALRLAELVRQEPTLLILDGIEPLQYPPGPGEGQVKDPGVRTLIRQLAAQNSGLCVITTRAAVSDLAHLEKTTCPRIDLETLQAADGAELLEKLGVDGTQKEREKASEEFGGHPLALTLLGTYLRDVHGGDIRRRNEIASLEEEMEHGDHARRVMDSYETWLGPGPETQILRMLGLFDRPAEAGAVKALRGEPGVEGLTDRIVGLNERAWQNALIRLRRAGLVAEVNPAEPGVIDAHPLVREHFGQKLRREDEAAWRAGHDRLFEYCRGPGCPKELPDTAEEMAPLFAAVQHGCNAGRFQETLDEVYWSRIQRGEEHYNWQKLGAFGSDLAALSGFFNPPWSTPTSALSDAAKAFLLNEAGFDLRALGRLAEAVEPMKAGLRIRVDQKKGQNAARIAGNLSELSLTLGRIDEAIAFAERSVEYADQSGDAFERMGKRTTLADALCQAGRFDRSEELFQESEAMQKDRQGQYPLLYALQGYRYCGLLLERGRHEDVLKRAAKMFEWRVPGDSLLGIGLDHLTLARAAVLAAESGRGEALDQARLSAQAAVDTLRRAGHQDDLPRGLLGRAEVYRVTGDLPAARADLSEVMEIARRDPAGHMKLFETDCHLALARLDLAAGDRAAAESHLDTAADLIQATGYHRRDGELVRLRAL